jgi:ABC-2 type transport system permease protein
MIRSTRLIAGYTEQTFLSWMGGRSFLFTLVVNQAITPLIGLAVWTTALPGESGVSTYYVALLAVRLVTVSYEHHTLSNKIYSGDLADDLLRPHPPILGTFGYNLAMRLWHVLFGLPLIAAVAALAGISVDLADVAVAVPALVLAAALRFLFTYILALSALWTERAHGVVGLGETLIFLLGGEAAPVPVLPEAVRPWVAALPFRAMLGFPAELASGSLGFSAALVGYGWQIGWIAIVAAAAAVVWRRGVRRYVAVGS